MENNIIKDEYGRVCSYEWSYGRIIRAEMNVAVGKLSEENIYIFNTTIYI